MAELRRAGYAKRLWDAWKDFEKEHGALSGVRLAALVEARIHQPFDDVKLSKIHRGKRRATVDEHYALAAELRIDPDVLAGRPSRDPGVAELLSKVAESGASYHVTPLKTRRKAAPRPSQAKKNTGTK